MSRRTKYLVAVALALAPTIVAPEVFSSAVHNNKLPFDATAVGDDGMPPPQNSNLRHHHHNRASHLSSSASSLDSSHHEDNEQDGAKSSTSGQDEYQNAASSARYERDSHADIDGSMTASSLFRIENDHGRQLHGGKKTTTRAMQDETVEDDDEYYYDDDDAYDDDEPVPAELWCKSFALLVTPDLSNSSHLSLEPMNTHLILQFHQSSSISRHRLLSLSLSLALLEPTDYCLSTYVDSQKQTLTGSPTIAPPVILSGACTRSTPNNYAVVRCLAGCPSRIAWPRPTA